MFKSLIYGMRMNLGHDNVEPMGQKPEDIDDAGALLCMILLP